MMGILVMPRELGCVPVVRSLRGLTLTIGIGLCRRASKLLYSRILVYVPIRTTFVIAFIPRRSFYFQSTPDMPDDPKRSKGL